MTENKFDESRIDAIGQNGNTGNHYIMKDVVRILAEQTGENEEDIKPASDLFADLKLDSLDVLEVIMAIEDEFGIHIEDDAAERIKTVQDLIEIVADKSANKEAHA